LGLKPIFGEAVRTVCPYQVPFRPQVAVSGVGAVAETITILGLEMTGTVISMDVPLMAAGLDSIAANEFSNMLTRRFDTELA